MSDRKSTRPANANRSEEIETMTEHRNNLLWLAAQLVAYPSHDFLRSLASLEAAVERGVPEPEKSLLLTFIGRLSGTDPVRLQERYTEAFDMTPGTTLDLTYHRFGDSDKRSAALTDLLDTYRSAGWEPAATELPDHLPVLLEFLSVCPECALRFQEDLEMVAGIASKLRKADHPYATLLEIIDGYIRRICSPHEATRSNVSESPSIGGRS
jgi:nitrate reductase delta subunit